MLLHSVCWVCGFVFHVVSVKVCGDKNLLQCSGFFIPSISVFTANIVCILRGFNVYLLWVQVPQFHKCPQH